MKKRIILGALVALLVLMAMPVMAQHTGQTLTIGGLVPLRLDLELVPTIVSQDLPLVGTAERVETVANLTISTNNSAGWELWVYSVNGSRLFNAAAAAEAAEGAPDQDVITANAIAYTVSFLGPGGDDPAPIPAGQGSGWDEDEGTGTGLLIGNAVDPGDMLDAAGGLLIHYTQQNDFRAGYYSDQLAVVLRAQ